jgi:hypothetical protein
MGGRHVTATICVTRLTLPRQFRDLPIVPSETVFPHGVVRGQLRQALYDGSALPQCLERLCVVVPFPERTREVGVRRPQVALP